MENLRGKVFRHVIITIGLLLHLHHQVALQTVTLTQPYSGECEQEDTIIGEEPIALLCRNNETDIVHNRAELQLDVDPGAFTCGLDGSEDFCTLAVVSECDRCANQNAYKRHVKEMIVDNLGTETWWQSITWSKIYPNPLEINVTFTYGDKLYELASDIEITFQSARPRTMVLWSSKDNGITWDPLQYYSSNRCPTFVRTRGVKTFFSRADLAAVVCTDKYSSVLPSSGGKVIFPLSERLDLVRRAGGSTALYSELARNDALQNFTLFNVLRIQLLHPATDGREIYGGDPSTYLKYYYGISDIEVTARCWCNLHGKCIDVGDREACQCKHNTAGTNCERCLPMFNELPWRRGNYLPYPIGTPNECMRCNCNNHAQTCVFNPLTSSGRCLDCTDNTTGEKCEKCLPGYYRNETAALNSSEVCLQCDCESLGTLDPNATCLTESNALTGQVSGQCMCRRGIVGQRCDLCGDGFYGLLVEPDIGTCKACACNRHGTVDASNVCNKTTGQCNCKPGITNRACDQCKEGYNSFPFGRLTGDCTACGCDPGGSFGLSCEPRQGQCKCRKNFIGQRCNQPRIGTFTPSLDAFSFKPKDTDCRNTSALRTQRRYTDRYFHVCEQQQFMGFGTIQGLRQLAAEWSYQPVLRYSYNSTADWQEALLIVTVVGIATDVRVDNVTGGCSRLAEDNAEFAFTLAPGFDTAWVSNETLEMDARCVYDFTLQLGQASSDGNASTTLTIDSLLLLPNTSNFTVYQLADDDQQAEYEACEQGLARLAERTITIIDPACSHLFLSLSAELYDGALPCDCDPLGSVPGSTCNPIGGSCSCKPGVFGQQCDRCEPGYFNMTARGCSPCSCIDLGAQSLVCDYVTGQCVCRPGVSLSGQENTLGLPMDRTCRSCLVGYYGYNTGEGCQECSCDEGGSESQQCNEDGCICKPTIGGARCDQCQDGYYNYSPLGCMACNCSIAGSLNETCDAFTGTCYCKANTEGVQCDSCVPRSFNLHEANPQGCQDCFCYGHGGNCSSAEGFYSSSIVASSTRLWEIAHVNGSPYLKAPPEFLNDQSASYMQYLSFELRSRRQPVWLPNATLVILESSEDTLLYQRTDLNISDDSFTEFNILLHESEFVTVVGDQPSSFQMHQLLSDLQALYIAMQLLNETSDVVDVSLDTGVQVNETQPENNRVMSVENCTCLDDHYVDGPQCMQCMLGHMRAVGNGTVYDVCLACNCSGNTLGDQPECNDTTGECLNCRNGTVGFHCEQCAPHVNEPFCTECERGYFGLSKEGCQACDCDPVGAEDIGCSQATGQCPCMVNVGGLKCDHCKLNYEVFSDQGCTPCDECYGNLLTEVMELAAMSDNLTTVVQSLYNHSLVSDLPRFRSRMRDAGNTITLLVRNLRNAESVNDEVFSTVLELNDTLEELTEAMLEQVPLLDEINGTLVVMENVTGQAMDMMSETNTTLYKVFQLLRGSIIQLDTRIQNLVNDLHDKEHLVLLLARDTITKLNGLANVTQLLQNQTMQAAQLIESGAELLKSTQEKQRNNTLQVEDLQKLLEQLRDLNRTLYEAATRTRVDTNTVRATIDVIFSKVLSTEISQDSHSALVNDAIRLKQAAQTLLQKSVMQTTKAHLLSTEVRTAQGETSRFQDFVSLVQVQSDDVASRANSTYERSLTAMLRADETFTNATEMLDVLQNFNTLSRRNKRLVRNALDKLEGLERLSSRAIRQSQSLQDELATALGASITAVDVAENVINQTTSENREVNALRQEAQRLQVDSAELRAEFAHESDVQSINASQVQVLRSSCDSVMPQLRTIEEDVTLVEGEAFDVLEVATDQRHLVDSLLGKMADIPRLSMPHLLQLQSELHELQNSFSKQDIAEAVKVLQDARVKQGRFLDYMRERASQAKGQIDGLKRLRSLRTQFN